MARQALPTSTGLAQMLLRCQKMPILHCRQHLLLESMGLSSPQALARLLAESSLDPKELPLPKPVMNWFLQDLANTKQDSEGLPYATGQPGEADETPVLLPLWSW